ncbi:MAG: tetratricopeptide repeat protein [Phocaeicola plebeius]|nr:tetratricopeptide repeat protein [Phocaeicola plebeius]
MKKTVILLFMAVAFVQGMMAAATKQSADEAYQQNRYEEAVRQYEELLATEGESADVYYNLGNSYYKSKQIAKAVLNYERALLLRPGDADIRFNLEMAKSKSVDQIVPTTEVFIVTWYNALVNSLGERSWSRMAVASFWLMLVGLAVYLFSRRIVWKKAGFLGAVGMVLVCICSNLFAHTQKSELERRDGAIVMAPSVTVKSTPDQSGTDLFVLHEGTKVFVEDHSMKEWKEVRLVDGKKGWLPASAIETI